MIPDVERIDLLAEIGIALLVFSLGLEFSIKHFGEVKLVSIFGGLMQVGLTALVVFGIVIAAGLGWREGLFLGCALSLSSTAIIYYLLAQKRLIDSPQGRIVIGIAIIQDMVAIPMIAILPIIISPAGISNYSTVVAALVKSAIVLGVFWVGGKFVLPKILHAITSTRSKELFLIFIMLIALGFGYLTNELGLSFALGAFLAGLMVAETDYRFHALSEIAPFRYCFNGLFFVSIGMLLQPTFLAWNWWWIPVIIFAIPLGKALVTAITVLLFKYPLGIAILAGLYLSQVGEFSFLVALVARQNGVISDYLYNLIIEMAFITILISPAMIAIGRPLCEWLDKVLPLSRMKCLGRGKMIDAGHLKDHVIICGFGPLGSSVGKILEHAQREFLVIELNPATVRRLKSVENRRVFLGDGASAEILYKSGIERALVLAVTAPDYMNSVAIIRQARNMNPSIKIITRAKYRNQVADLYAAGADIVISEELEAGIEMGRHVLVHMGIGDAAIEQYSQQIRVFSMSGVDEKQSF